MLSGIYRVYLMPPRALYFHFFEVMLYVMQFCVERKNIFDIAFLQHTFNFWFALFHVCFSTSFVAFSESRFCIFKAFLLCCAWTLFYLQSLFLHHKIFITCACPTFVWFCEKFLSRRWNYSFWWKMSDRCNQF